MELLKLDENIEKIILKSSLKDFHSLLVKASYVDTLDIRLEKLSKEIRDHANQFMKTIKHSLDEMQKAYKNLRAQAEYQNNPKYKEHGERMLRIRQQMELAVDNIQKTLDKDPRLKKADILELIRYITPQKKVENSFTSSHMTLSEIIELI